MTASRLRSALAVLRWDSAVLARELDVNPRTVRRWLAGTGAVPAGVLGWLEDLAAGLPRLPAPEVGRGRRRG